MFSASKKKAWNRYFRSKNTFVINTLKKDQIFLKSISYIIHIFLHINLNKLSRKYLSNPK